VIPKYRKILIVKYDAVLEVAAAAGNIISSSMLLILKHGSDHNISIKDSLAFYLL